MQTLATTDFETIPDLALAEYLTGYVPSASLLNGPDAQDIVDDNMSRIEALKKYAADKNKGDENAMLPPGLNMIVAGGIHLADIRFDQNIGEWYETKHLSSTAENEKKVVTDMVNYFDRLKPRFVTFNGRSFDFPLLQLRAMHHGVPMPFWFTSGDKWNNYTSRYAPDYHFDVMDFIASQGAAPRMKLRELMAILKLPDKVYTGANVLDLWLTNSVAHIREYCELDCFNTFLCYVYCQHLRGSISDAGRDCSIRSAIMFCLNHLDQTHLVKFLDEWCSLNPVIAHERAHLTKA